MKKILFFLSLAMLASCSSDESSSSTVAFFRANLNGQSVNYSQNSSSSPDYYNQPSVGFNGDGSNKSFYYGSSMDLYGTMESYPSLDVTMHNMYQSTSYADETTNFNTTFDSKPTNFISYDDDSNWIKGVSVTHIDANGDIFSTLSGSQSGSSISYTSMTTATNDFGFQTKTVTGTVNCTLYKDSDPSETITLTNGSFKLTFQEFD